MLMMGKSLLDLDRIDSLEEIFGRIKQTSAAELREVANEMFHEDQLSLLTYIPN